MASTDVTSIALDQRKRAFEALERRFSVVKEINHNQINKKRCFKEGKEYEDMQEHARENSLARPKIGKQAANPAYQKLCPCINENLVRPIVQPSNRRVSSVNKILHDLLRKGDFASKYMQRPRGLKLDNWFLLDNFVRSEASLPNVRAKILQSHSKRSRKHMSMKQHRKHGSFVFPHEYHKFDLFKPMHEMWKEYIDKLLKGSGINQIPRHILTADLHGSILLVVECKTAEFTGVNGIMIRETMETFGIISEDNKFRVVPKKGCVFIFQAGRWKVTLHGDKLSLRNVGS